MVSFGIHTQVIPLTQLKPARLTQDMVRSTSCSASSRPCGPSWTLGCRDLSRTSPASLTLRLSCWAPPISLQEGTLHTRRTSVSLRALRWAVSSREGVIRPRTDAGLLVWWLPVAPWRPGGCQVAAVGSTFISTAEAQS